MPTRRGRDSMLHRREAAGTEQTGVRAVSLSCGRGGRMALSDLTFTAGAGDFLAFTGPNGIGKTTLLRNVAGLGEPMAGALSAPVDDCVFLGHDNGLKPELTVAENLRFWVRIFGGDLSHEASLPFGIETLLNREVRHMSSGQQRKAALASVMLSRRRIWIIDEPANSLDDESAAEFARLADGHCRAGGTVIAATHSRFKGAACRYIDLAGFAEGLGRSA